MKKLLQIFIVLVINITAIKAQTTNEGYYNGSDYYKNSVGLRLGSETGISMRKFLQPTGAFEGIISTGYRGVIFTALYERYKPAFTSEFRWYYGAGAHIAFFDNAFYPYTSDNYNYYYYTNMSYVSIGLDAILGLEYMFPTVPISLSIDFKPYVDVIYPGYGFIDTGFTVRYLFFRKPQTK